MTAQGIDARRTRQRRARERLTALLVLLGTAFLIGCLVGCLVGRIFAAGPSVEPPAAPADPTVSTVPQSEAPAPEGSQLAPESTPEPVRHRDDIVSEGRLLSYELQDIMQDCCERYNVPYALALAIAEVESHFDPDAQSSTNDYGLMQINKINHAWLKDLGMDPLTYAGNIEAGVYMIGQQLEAYGDPELAVMAYNNGPTGARRLWDAGIYQTEHSRKVMEAFERWTSILED